MRIVDGHADIARVRIAVANLKVIHHGVRVTRQELKQTFYTLGDAPDKEYVNTATLARQLGIRSLTRFQKFLRKHAGTHVRYEHLARNNRITGKNSLPYQTQANTLLLDVTVVPAICRQLNKTVFADLFSIDYDNSEATAARKHWQQLS